MGHVVQHFQQQHEALLLSLVCTYVVIDDLESARVDQLGVLFSQHLLAPLTQHGRQLNNGVFKGGVLLILELTEVSQNTVCCCPVASPGLHYAECLFLLGGCSDCVDVVGYCQAVIRFEYLRGCQPGILGVLVKQFLLVVLVAQHGFEVQRLSE